MAMNKQDYQYVSNSFDRLKNRVDDGELKIGSTIKNLVVELSQDTVYNPDYSEFYGTKTPEEVWSVKASTVYKTTSVITSKPGAGNSISVKESGTANWISETTNVSGKANIRNSNNQFYYRTTITAKGEVDEGSVIYKLISGTVVGTEVSGKTIVCTIIGPKGTDVSASILYKWKQTLYDVIYTHKIPIGETFKSVESSQEISGTSYSNNELKVSFKKIAVQYPAIKIVTSTTSNTAKTDTIKNGLLQHKTKLEKNTSYVLQVINGIKSSKTSSIENNIYDSNNTFSKSFDQYLFFKTPNEDLNITLDINGIAFGYRIIDKTTGVNGAISFKELRSIKDSRQAKVFLFKSDLPWIVNDKGIIVGLRDIPLDVPEEASESADNVYLTEADIEKIFSETPKLKVEESTLSIIPPGGSEDGWIYRSFWDWTYAVQTKPQIMENLCLLVYRNYLTTETRTHNKQKRKLQYGKLNNIQRTVINTNDKLTTEFKDISFEPIMLGNASFPSFEWVSGSEETIFIGRNANGENSLTYPTIAKFALAGYNYTHGLTTKDIYKYTSVSFAWGYRDGKGRYKRLSGYSIPLIIDRSSVEINTKNTDKYILILQNRNLHKKTSTEYYNGEAIYLDEEKTS